MAEASNRHLTRVQRCKIEAHVSSGHSLRAIASDLGVAASTVSREVQRNGLSRGRYDEQQADAMAAQRRRDTSSRPWVVLVKNSWGRSYAVGGLG